MYFWVSFFLIWTILKKFLMNLLQHCFCFMVFWPRGMWDLGSLTRDPTHMPCTGRQSLNHWTTRKIPTYNFNLHVLSSHYKTIYRVPGGSDSKEFACNEGDEFNPWVGKIPWRRERQLTPLCWPGESQGRGSLVGYRLWGRTVGHD